MSLRIERYRACQRCGRGWEKVGQPCFNCGEVVRDDGQGMGDEFEGNLSTRQRRRRRHYIHSDGAAMSGQPNGSPDVRGRIIAEAKKQKARELLGGCVHCRQTPSNTIVAEKTGLSETAVSRIASSMGLTKHRRSRRAMPA